MSYMKMSSIKTHSRPNKSNYFHYVFPSFSFKIHSPNPSSKLLWVIITPSLTSTCKFQDKLYPLCLPWHLHSRGRERKEEMKILIPCYDHDHPQSQFLGNSYRGVQPFGLSGPHWKKKSCLWPHIKYTNTNENWWAKKKRF